MKYFLKNLFIPFKTIDKHLPKKGIVLDLGCGEGAIAFYLANQKNRHIIGIDADKKRISLANKNNQQNLNFIASDLFKASFPDNIAGCVVSDVLHHLSLSQQKQLLRKITRSIKKGGVLIIKEINISDMIRSKLSRLWDYILYPKDKINYLSKTELINLLEKNNYKVTHHKMHLLVPASIHLYIGTKL